MRTYGEILLAVIAFLSVAIFGNPTLAKLSWLAGVPAVTLALSDDPGARGAALYELGRFAEADAAFSEIGRGATYNRAATLAATGDYALSVAYYDAVLFADRWDAEAQANRAVVDALVTPVIGEARGHGRIDSLLSQAGAQVAGFDSRNPLAPAVIPEQNSRRPVDAQSVVADASWLETLTDAPGEYLARRLAAEYARRVEEGLAHVPEPGQW